MKLFFLSVHQWLERNSRESLRKCASQAREKSKVNAGTNTLRAMRLGAFGTVKGIGKIPDNLDRGMAITAVSMGAGGTLATISFVSAGRNQRKGHRIKGEIKRRGER